MGDLGTLVGVVAVSLEVMVEVAISMLAAAEAPSDLALVAESGVLVVAGVAISMLAAAGAPSDLALEEGFEELVVAGVAGVLVDLALAVEFGVLVVAGVVISMLAAAGVLADLALAVEFGTLVEVIAVSLEVMVEVVISMIVVAGVPSDLALAGESEVLAVSALEAMEEAEVDRYLPFYCTLVEEKEKILRYFYLSYQALEKESPVGGGPSSRTPEEGKILML